jgi:hypothetical protein
MILFIEYRSWGFKYIPTVNSVKCSNCSWYFLKNFKRSSVLDMVNFNSWNSSSDRKASILEAFTRCFLIL